jgi:hypothetical protein
MTLDLAKAQALAMLMQRLGYALWQAAACEDMLAHWVVIRLRPSKGAGDIVGNQLLGKAQQRTFGQLVRELRDQNLLEQVLEQRLIAFLDERNWLVHRSKRENRGILSDLARYESLVSRLDGLAEEATSLQSLLGAELEAFVINSGVDKAYIDSQAAKILADLGY